MELYEDTFSSESRKSLCHKALSGFYGFIRSYEKRSLRNDTLYGLNDIKEISKAIYFELRVKKIGSKNEKFEAGKIVAKTLLKNGLSAVGIDLSVKEEDLEKLYTSIDLSDKLIILEDLERSGISIKQVLGYVNNLVEQDGAKVLILYPFIFSFCEL